MSQPFAPAQPLDRKEALLAQAVDTNHFDRARDLLIDEYQRNPTLAINLLRAEMRRERATGTPNRIEVTLKGDVLIQQPGQRPTSYATLPRELAVLLQPDRVDPPRINYDTIGNQPITTFAPRGNPPPNAVIARPAYNLNPQDARTANQIAAANPNMRVERYAPAPPNYAARPDQQNIIVRPENSQQPQIYIAKPEYQLPQQQHIYVAIPEYQLPQQQTIIARPEYPPPRNIIARQDVAPQPSYDGRTVYAPQPGQEQYAVAPNTMAAPEQNIPTVQDQVVVPPPQQVVEVPPPPAPLVRHPHPPRYNYSAPPYMGFSDTGGASIQRMIGSMLNSYDGGPIGYPALGAPMAIPPGMLRHAHRWLSF